MVENIVGEVEKAASVSNRASNIPLYALSAIALFAVPDAPSLKRVPEVKATVVDQEVPLYSS